MTGESESEVQAYIDAHEQKYPIAIGMTGDYDVTGIPHAFLIDKDGKIVWRGHPAGLDEKQLTPLLAGAKPATVCAGLEDVFKLRHGEQFGEARKLALKLLEQGQLSEPAQGQARQWVAAIEADTKERVAAAAAAETDKDVYLLWQHLDDLALHYQGVPGAEDAKERLEKLLAAKPNVREIDAGKRFAEAMRLEEEFDFTAAMDIYKELGTRHSSTRAGRNAKARHREMLEKGMLGYDQKCNYCKAAERACPTHRRKR